ncbi:MAG: hypothetical protein J5742_02865 [Alphaproteobacteria bacterium]|nr:hypothetical protein [Alphaproteobacteria bacterium]
MGKVGQHISDFRKTTPKSVLWIFLIAALVIAIILLLLLIGNKRSRKVMNDADVIPITPELRFEPNNLIDWSNTMVNDIRNAEIQVYANTRVQITNLVVQVESEDDDDVGLSASATCTNEQTFVTEDTPCLITIEYAPTHSMPRTNVGVSVTWTAFEVGPEPIETKNAITAIIGAHEKPKSQVEPVEMPPEEEFYEEDEYEEETYDDEPGFEDDIYDLAPPLDFAQPAPTQPVAPVSKKYKSAFGNNCSDFSFPGYNTAGIQSGWITPEAGAYYYHPFSDAECKNPTGIYNADTGYIMDINNTSRKIGSDAEHIRLTIQERMPTLGGGKSRRVAARARQLTDAELGIQISSPASAVNNFDTSRAHHIALEPRKKTNEFSGYEGGDTVYSTLPYDRTFVLRQYKPIPATIVSDIQADAKLLQSGLPVRATVDRNVYSDNGRTVIIPTGTLMLGRVVGELPGPYKAVGRMEIEWYQFIRPDGVEFAFESGKNPFSADSQGRKGVPGHGSTDYIQQFVMPMLTAIVPAAVNMIAPISDAFVNQIDLDNNTVVQSGTVRSSELAKNEIITAWNNVATKLLVDMMDNTTPPFSIAAGTRITVFSPVDLVITCGDPDQGDTRNCAVHAPAKIERGEIKRDIKESQNVEELIGQVRSMMQASLKETCCQCKEDSCFAPVSYKSEECRKYSFSTLDFYCRSFGTYEAKNNAKQKAVFENQKEQMQQKTTDTETYNKEVLGLKYDEDGNIKNPFKKEKNESAPTPVDDSSVVTCDNGANPDANGCCPGETYTDMGEQGFNCCPDAGGDCFPPIEL